MRIGRVEREWMVGLCDRPHCWGALQVAKWLGAHRGDAAWGVRGVHVVVGDERDGEPPGHAPMRTLETIAELVTEAGAASSIEGIEFVPGAVCPPAPGPGSPCGCCVFSMSPDQCFDGSAQRCSVSSLLLESGRRTMSSEASCPSSSTFPLPNAGSASAPVSSSAVRICRSFIGVSNQEIRGLRVPPVVPRLPAA